MSSLGKNREPRRVRVHAERVKSAHTSHWDLDYLPSDVVELAYEVGRSRDADQSSDSEKG